MKKLRVVFRWTWRVLLVLLVIFVVFILEESIRGRILLTRYKAELRAKGEKLTIEEFNFPKPVDNDAIRTLLASAGELTNLSQAFIRDALESGCRLRFIGPGCCVIHHLQPATDIRVPPPRGTRYEAGTYYVCTWEELAEKVTFAREYLRVIRTILQKPVLAASVDYGSAEFDVLQYRAAAAIGTWSLVAALSDLRQNDLDAALEDLLTSTDLMQSLQDSRSYELQARRMFTGEAALGMTWEALQMPGWEDRQLATLQTAWERASLINKFEPSAEVLRAVILERWDGAIHKPMPELLGWSGISFNSWDDDSRFLHGVVWYLAWREQDETRGVRLWANGVDAVRNSLKASSWTIASNEFNRAERDELESCRGLYDHWRYQMSVPAWAFTWGPENLRYDVLRILEYETFREMAITAIALKRSELRHGKPSTDLTTLVPNFLSRIPHDYMDASDLHYRLNADGTWTLYSVGEDGVDNGGDPTIAEAGLASKVWWGRDAVWPTAATPQEVEALESLRMQRDEPPRALRRR